MVYVKVPIKGYIEYREVRGEKYAVVVFRKSDGKPFGKGTHIVRLGLGQTNENCDMWVHPIDGEIELRRELDGVIAEEEAKKKKKKQVRESLTTV